MKQPPSKKPPAKVPAKAPAKAPAKQPAKAPSRVAPKPPKKQQIVEEEILEDDIPTHPPEPEPPEPESEPVEQAKPEFTIGGEKVEPVKILGFIESIIGTLTFRTVALVALLTAISLVLFALYENRTEIVHRFTTRAPVTTAIAAPSNWVLSEASKQSLIALAKATSVRMVIFSDVDLKKNRRVVRYYYLDDQAIVLQPLALQTLSLPLPVFDYDSKNTEQMIATLSNDFRCDAFADTVYNRFAPELADEFPTVCRLAVPPFVGTFVGFIAVGVGPNTSPTELETIRLEVSRIAVEIYMNDVSKKLTPAPRK